MPASRPRLPSTPPARRRGSHSLLASSEPLSEYLTKNNSIGEPWQRDAWDAYDMVPELRTIARITAQAMAQCRFVIARVSNEGEPAPLDADGEDRNHPAVLLLSQFAGGAPGQSELLDTLGTQLTVAGEASVVGALNPALQRIDSFLRMQAYSTEQVTQLNRAITVRLGDNSQSDRVINEDEGNRAIRIWRPHPRFSWQADSMARSAAPILREIMLYDQHLAASALSRLVGAGLLFIPEGMTLPGLAVEDGAEPDADPFMELLKQVMGTAIKNRESASALTPILIRGEPEDIEAVRWMTFLTEFSEKVMELRQSAIARLSMAADMPNEMLTGLGDAQHWNGSMITDSWVGTYLAGLMTMVCGSLTTGWLYPAMLEQAERNGQQAPPADVILWYDASSLRTRPNVVPEAEALYTDHLISAAARRRAVGMDEADAPDPIEYQRQVLLELLRLAPALAPQILPLLGIDVKLQTEGMALGTPAPPGGNRPGASPTANGREPAISPAPAQR